MMIGVEVTVCVTTDPCMVVTITDVTGECVVRVELELEDDDVEDEVELGGGA